MNNDIKNELDKLEETKKHLEDPFNRELFFKLSEAMNEIFEWCVANKDSLKIGDPNEDNL